MKPVLSFFIFFLPLITAGQQSQRADEWFRLNTEPLQGLSVQSSDNFDLRHSAPVDPAQPVRLLFAPKKINLSGVTPFLSFSCGWDEVNHKEANSRLYVRFSADGRFWQDWQELKKDTHYDMGRFSFVSELLFLDKELNYFQIQVLTNQKKEGGLLQQLYCNFFSPGALTGPWRQHMNNDENPSLVARGASCACAQPAFVSRTGWNCPQAPWTPSTTTFTHLIVHHSAGSNTATDWGAVVLSIWNFHVNTNGWSDIGYNWLIAPSGILYEGRQNSSTQDVLGAHFCGTNGGVMGVCMLGTYNTENLTSNARNTLLQTLAWKSCQRNIDPTTSSLHSSSGLVLNHISGHRQGCSTECPGNTVFNDLPALRLDVKNYQDNGCLLTPVPEVEGLEELQILPNPVHSELFIRLKLQSAKDVQYRILSSDGRQIYISELSKMSGASVTKLDVLQQQPAAVYLLQLWIDGHLITKQIVKQ